MADRLSGIFGHQVLQLSLCPLVREMRVPGAEENSGDAQALDVLISTIRIASIRGFGGSTPNSLGVSPFSTHRQNLRSAVTMRC